ncbi:MAG: glycosyltransferase family 61 protein [Bacteroidaceae bacterium]|nr:glycosyltransferase family 61 protein [Bacteroidaceae bacterium]
MAAYRETFMTHYNFSYVHKQSCQELQQASNVNRLVKKKLEVRKYSNAIINALGEAHALITEEDACHQTQMVEEERKKCVFLGYFVTCWGHILTDGFKKTWFFETEYCQQLISEGVEFVYVTTNGRDILPANLEMLHLAGIDTTFFHRVLKNTRYEEVIVPDDCFWGGIENTCYTIEYSHQLEKLRNSIYRDFNSNIEKVYFTRTQLHDKREQGEKDVEEVFRKLGYTVCSPEKMSVKEQLSMVSHCKYFAATEGSIAHISVFCQPETAVTIIRKADYINGYQLAINQVANLNVIYLDAHESWNVSAEWPWGGPFYLCVNELLEKYVGHRIPHIPHYLKPSWWWYMNKNRKVIHHISHFIRKR